MGPDMTNPRKTPAVSDDSGKARRCCVLAHPRLTVHHQHPALTGTHRLDQPVQHAALGTPVRQLAHAASQLPKSSTLTCPAA